LSRAIDPPRPDKNGNSRFEYTKILKRPSCRDFIGLAPLEIKSTHMFFLMTAIIELHPVGFFGAGK
ncbi:MAG TPA: hypothetical protein PLI57_00890, partial [Spirochaetota bacterium]|nr:hypothetical protein [Spirochaetota bacterium]